MKFSSIGLLAACARGTAARGAARQLAAYDGDGAYPACLLADFLPLEGKRPGRPEGVTGYVTLCYGNTGGDALAAWGSANDSTEGVATLRLSGLALNGVGTMAIMKDGLSAGEGAEICNGGDYTANGRPGLPMPPYLPDGYPEDAFKLSYNADAGGFVTYSENAAIPFAPTNSNNPTMFGRFENYSVLNNKLVMVYNGVGYDEPVACALLKGPTNVPTKVPTNPPTTTAPTKKYTNPPTPQDQVVTLDHSAAAAICPPGFISGRAYESGDRVSVANTNSVVEIYQCKEGFNHLYCAQAAFGPGQGLYWETAWDYQGHCEAAAPLLSTATSPGANLDCSNDRNACENGLICLHSGVNGSDRWSCGQPQAVTASPVNYVAALVPPGTPNLGGCPGAWSVNGAYGAGARVAKNTVVYQCKGTIMGLHCPQAGYEPGVAWGRLSYWIFAWDIVGICSA